MKKFILSFGLLGASIFGVQEVGASESPLQTNDEISHSERSAIEEAIGNEKEEYNELSDDEISSEVHFGETNDPSERSFRELATGTSNIGGISTLLNSSSTTSGNVWTSTLTATNNILYNDNVLASGDTESTTLTNSVTSDNRLTDVATGVYRAQGIHTATDSGAIFSANSGDVTTVY